MIFCIFAERNQREINNVLNKVNYDKETENHLLYIGRFCRLEQLGLHQFYHH
jgi:hypothetical protein